MKYPPFYFIMTIKNQYLFFSLLLLIAQIIAQSAYAHRATMSFTEVVIHPQEWVFTMTFHKMDIIDAHFLAILEQSVLTEEPDLSQLPNDTLATIIKATDSGRDMPMQLADIKEQGDKVSLVVHLHTVFNAVNNIHFPIVDKFAHGHRQLVTVLRDTAPAAQYLVHADDRSIALSGHKENSRVK